MYKAIIFDVDGTLLDTERIYMQAWQQAGSLCGYAISNEVLLKTRAIAAKEAVKIFRAALGEDFDIDLVRPHRVRIAEELIAAAQPQQLWMPGVPEVLQQLKSRMLPLSVASSTEYDKTLAHLAHAGLDSYFDAVVGGDMVTHGKPAPDIFLKAAQLLGVAPEHCLVVGDTPADVNAAAAAGMDVVLIPDQVPANPQTTALSVAVLSDLRQLIPEVIGKAV